MASAAPAADERTRWKEATREGQQLQQARKHAEAANKFIDALRHAQRCNCGNEVTALTLNDLSSVSYQMGDFSKAQQYSRRALELFGKLGKQDHPGFAVALNNLAMADVEKGQYREAEQLFRQSIDCRVRSLAYPR